MLMERQLLFHTKREHPHQDFQMNNLLNIWFPENELKLNSEKTQLLNFHLNHRLSL